MLLQRWSCLSSCSRSQLRLPPQSQSYSSQPRITVRGRRKDTSSVCVVSFNEIVDIAHNKVLIAATISAAIGQLLKPLTSTILYGKKKKIDIRAAFQSGGFPSTHSSAVVATATALGIERGFSDAIFGLAVVYASLVMYDAQGVRREVGVHAKELNKIIGPRNSFIPNGDSCSQPQKSYSNIERSFEPKVLNLEANPTESLNTKIVNNLVSISEDAKVPIDIEGGESEKIVKRLKESVGHSETEVIGGAFLGLFVSLALYTII